jgi:hypothetical protein
MRTFKLIARFYRGIFFSDFLITLCCVVLLKYYSDKAGQIIGIIFWFKVITIGVIFYSSIQTKKRELYYYQNLGVSKIMLGVYTSVFDFLLWLGLTIIVY